MGINIVRGRSDIDCGCGAKPQALSNWLLVRNAVLAAAALVVAQPEVARSLGWQDFLLLALMTPIIALAYAATEQLISNHNTLKHWGRDFG